MSEKPLLLQGLIGLLRKEEQIDLKTYKT